MTVRDVSARPVPLLRPCGRRLACALGLRFALCAASTLAGCGGEAPVTLRGELCAVPGCAPGCEELEVKACNVAEQSCRDLVFESLRCVRGGKLTRSAVTVVRSPGEPVVPSATVAAMPPPGEQIRLDAVGTALKLLRLMGQTVSVTEAEVEANAGVVAVFDPKDQQVQIVDTGKPSWPAMTTLAHEYTHALQDAEVPQSELLDRYATDATTRQGVLGYVEGEAQLFGLLTYAFMRRIDMERWDTEGYLADLLHGAQAQVADAVSPYPVAKRTLHYPLGLRYVWENWLAEGHVGVRRLRKQLDANLGHWMNGYFARGDWAALTCGAPKIPRDFRWIAQDSLGPSGVYALAVSHLPAADSRIERAWSSAEAARGDVLRIYAASDPSLSVSAAAPFADLVSAGEVRVEWTLAFADSAKAKRFAEELDADNLTLKREQERVLISVSSSSSGDWTPGGCSTP